MRSLGLYTYIYKLVVFVFIILLNKFLNSFKIDFEKKLWVIPTVIRSVLKFLKGYIRLLNQTHDLKNY